MATSEMTRMGIKCSVLKASRIRPAALQPQRMPWGYLRTMQFQWSKNEDPQMLYLYSSANNKSLCRSKTFGRLRTYPDLVRKSWEKIKHINIIFTFPSLPIFSKYAPASRDMRCTISFCIGVFVGNWKVSSVMPYSKLLVQLAWKWRRENRSPSWN